MKTIIAKASMVTFLCASILSCTSTSKKSTMEATPGVTVSNFGTLEGKEVSLYTLTNKNGIKVSITNYGGIVTSWITPDKKGQMANIVLGFDSLTGL